MIVKRCLPVRAFSGTEQLAQTEVSDWKKYKGWPFRALEKYNRETDDWTAKAVVYGKSTIEKHRCIMDGLPNSFADRTAAVGYAIAASRESPDTFARSSPSFFLESSSLIHAVLNQQLW
jgi:hypothetical protein